MRRIIYGVAIFTAGLVVVQAFAENEVGKKFGSRDPRTCLSRKDPARGALTAAQAKQYFACDNEVLAHSGSVGDLLYLVTDIVVEIGKSHPFNALTDSYPGIDPSQPVYPIRGSYVSWQCGVVGTIGAAAGHNCARNEGSSQTGNCYKDAFGDWHCKMCCTLGSNQKAGYPPPTGL